MRRREFIAAPAAMAAMAQSRPRRGIALNEDNSHFFTTRASRPVAAETIDAWVDQYAGTQVRELILCVNSMRTSYASKVWDPIWRGYDPGGADSQPLFASLPEAARPQARKWVHTAWAYADKGIDVYARMIARARKHGLSPWVSMRMNDIHDVNDERSYMHSEFWRANPQLRRVPYRDGFREKAFDYGRAEVREHHMKLVRELVERYDFDGFELDWMRFGFHFRPGHEARGAELLTEFTREVRALLRAKEKRTGRRIRLAARVPTRPQTALGLGMDAVRWARDGLIDFLTVTPFWASIEPDIPIELWRELLRGTSVTLAAGLEVLIRPYHEYARPPLNSIETARGAAAALLDRGADRIYLFNYMDSETTTADPENYPKLLRELGELETIEGKTRRHVLTYADTWAPGEPAAPPMLPLACAPGRRGEFRIPIGPKPRSGEVAVLIGVEEAPDSQGASWEVRLNGERCQHQGPRPMAQPAPPRPMIAFRAPVEAVNRGYNLVEVSPASTGRLMWVEIAVLAAP